MYLFGFIVALLLANKRSQQAWSPITKPQVEDLIFYAMLGVILGGRLGYVFFYGWQQLMVDPLYLFKITHVECHFMVGWLG